MFEYITVNKNAVPHIIGKKGLQLKTNTKINISQHKSSCKIRIESSKKNIETAKTLINFIINNSIQYFYHSELILQVLQAAEQSTVIPHRFKAPNSIPGEVVHALEFKKRLTQDLSEELERVTIHSEKQDIVLSGSTEEQETFEKLVDAIREGAMV
jgi:hypothetical protein